MPMPMNNMLNPMLGLDVSEEQKKQMLGMALLAGGAGTMANANRPGSQPLGMGLQAMMGSLEDQQQMALLAQMQGLQRKNIESGMEMRGKEFEQRGKQFDQTMGMQERRMGMDAKRLELEKRRADLAGVAAGRQGTEFDRKMQEEQARMDSAGKIQQMMQSGAPEQELAQAIMAHTMRFGGSPSSNVSNVLMPSGAPRGGGDMFSALMGGGGGPGFPEMGGAPMEEGPPAQVAPQQASTLDEGFEKTEELSTAARAARAVQDKQIEAQRFVNSTLLTSSMGTGGLGLGGEEDPEKIKEVISKASELWPMMGERERMLTLEHVRRLKERIK